MYCNRTNFFPSSVCVVESLGAKSLEKNFSRKKRRAVVNVGINQISSLHGWLKLNLTLLDEKPTDSSPVKDPFNDAPSN